MLDQSDKNRFRSELFRVTQILTIELRFPPEFSGLIPLSFHNPWSQIYNHKRKPSFPTTYRCMLWAQSKCVWLTLCNPTECNPPASSVHRIFRQEHWSGLPLPPPGDLPYAGIKTAFPVCPALHANSLPLSHQGSPLSTNSSPKYQ